MSAAAPNPNNMLILAVLGIGAFWFMTRRASAAAPIVLTGQQSNNAAKANLAASGINALTKLLGGVAAARPLSNAAAGASSNLFNYDTWFGPASLGTQGGSFDFSGASPDFASYFSADAVAVNPAGTLGDGWSWASNFSF